MPDFPFSTDRPRPSYCLLLFFCDQNFRAKQIIAKLGIHEELYHPVIPMLQILHPPPDWPAWALLEGLLHAPATLLLFHSEIDIQPCPSPLWQKRPVAGRLSWQARSE